MSVVIRGALPSWMPLASLLPALAPMEPLAINHGGVLVVECERNSITIAVETAEGKVCLECGAPLEKRVKRVSTFGKSKSSARNLLISFCDLHPTVHS